MGDKNPDQSIMDKSMRSVFVGNIPYEATEEKLKEIFSEVGPVISLKLVFDRESGKPKGYGFCEYKDQETALSAMRNLNGYEIGGRTLRVDNACTEKSRMEMQQLLQGPQIENPYGEPCDPENAPEIITKTVASLPPEQMYELMRQMKLCIQNNPAEARQMLLLNPQLAYALLQAQVVMRIVDPQMALSMLFKANQMPPVLALNPITGQPQQQLSPPVVNQQQAPIPQPIPPPNTIPPLLGNFQHNQDIDLRAVDPRLGRAGDQDMRGMPNPLPVQPPMPVPMPNVDSNMNRNPRPVQPPTNPIFPIDPRQRHSDPRIKQQIGMPQQPLPQQQQQPMQTMPQMQPMPMQQIPPQPFVNQQQQQQQQNRVLPGAMPNDTDQEKAALIMQVLQLSDDQIAMLPQEQRASILVLKEQIAKSTQR